MDWEIPELELEAQKLAWMFLLEVILSETLGRMGLLVNRIVLENQAIEEKYLRWECF